METIELEPITSERLLIYENYSEISRVKSEVEMRASMLNAINKHGLSPEEIKNISSSKGSIELFIENRLQAENPEYARMIAAGIQGVTAKLSDRLQELKDALLRLESFKAGRGGKFDFLTFTYDKWIEDSEALENLFIRNRLKVYISDEKLTDYKEIESLCRYFEKNDMPSNQIRESSFLWARIEPVASNQYRPRWTWFLER